MLTVRLSPFDLDPVQHLNRMTEQFRRAFGDDLPTGPTLNRSGFPTLNAWQDGQAFYVEAEIPGLGLEDLEITLPEADLVSIKGLRKAPAPEGAQWLRRERACGSFERQFRLPGPVAGDDVEATLASGVLTVKLPKAPEIRPRKIAVRSA
jgi:HSP20 family protein